ncbi:MAG: phospholipase D-like domain-containing protein [Thermodesulfobacteriota bacterium]
MKIYALIAAAFLFCGGPLPALAADAKPVPPAGECRMVIKDVSVTPEQAPNNGLGAITLSCSVFSTADSGRVRSVKADFRHTDLGREIELKPIPGQVLSPSGDGRYQVIVPLPELMDTGAYRAPITALDSLGCSGTREACFSISFAVRPDIPEIGAPAFAERLAAIAASPLTRGNSVACLSSGKEALERRLLLTRNARRQVNLESYTFDGSLAGGAFMEALTGAAARGVEVNVLLNADTQVSTGPIDSLRLYANELAADLTRKARAGIEKSPAPGLAALLPGPEFRGVNLAFFSSAREVSQALLADHWLSRVLMEKVPLAAAKAIPEGMRDRFTGPGGLPALPLLSHGLHEKMLIADGKCAVVGGRNLEDRYFTHWNDVDLYLEGPAVNEIQKAFLSSFADAAEGEKGIAAPTGLLLGGRGKGGVPLIFVHSLPWRGDRNTLLSLVYALSACRKQAYLSSQFLALPDCLLSDAITDAARRGVDVRILTNSLETSRETSFAFGYMISLNHMQKLLDAGVRIFTVKPGPDENAPQPYLHAKQFALDGRVLAVGSFNLSVRSSYIESENLAFVFDEELAEKRRDDFLKELENAEEMTPARLAALGKEHRAAMEMARYLDLLF